jgi:hypothetical protein
VDNGTANLRLTVTTGLRSCVLGTVLIGLFVMHGLGLGHGPTVITSPSLMSAAMSVMHPLAPPAAAAAIHTQDQPAGAAAGGPVMPSSPAGMSHDDAMCLAILVSAFLLVLSRRLLGAAARCRSRAGSLRLGQPAASRHALGRAPAAPSLLALCVSLT